jgi:hypothetical protein
MSQSGLSKSVTGCISVMRQGISVTSDVTEAIATQQNSSIARLAPGVFFGKQPSPSTVAYRRL